MTLEWASDDIGSMLHFSVENVARRDEAIYHHCPLCSAHRQSRIELKDAIAQITHFPDTYLIEFYPRGQIVCL